MYIYTLTNTSAITYVPQQEAKKNNITMNNKKMRGEKRKNEHYKQNKRKTKKISHCFSNRTETAFGFACNIRIKN